MNQANHFCSQNFCPYSHTDMVMAKPFGIELKRRMASPNSKLDDYLHTNFQALSNKVH